MGDQEHTEAATATEIGGITFLSPPTAVPSSRRHLLLDETAVQRPFNETETTADHDGDKTKDGQDPRDAETPAAVAATQKERSPPTLEPAKSVACQSDPAGQGNGGNASSKREAGGIDPANAAASAGTGSECEHAHY